MSFLGLLLLFGSVVEWVNALASSNLQNSRVFWGHMLACWGLGLAGIILVLTGLNTP